MDVGVQRRPAALNCRHRPGTPADPQRPRPALLEPEQRPHEHPEHGAAEAVVVGQPIPQPEGERQHPLAHRQAAKDTVDQVCGERAHAPTAARRTDPPLARKGHQNLSRTAVAPEAGKAPCHDSTGHQLPQLALDEARQAVATAPLAGFGQEGLQVLADDTVQDALFRLAAHVCPPPAAELAREPARAAGRLDLRCRESGAVDSAGGARGVRARHVMQHAARACSKPVRRRSPR